MNSLEKSVGISTGTDTGKLLHSKLEWGSFLKPFKTIEEQIATTWDEDMIQEEFKKVVGV